MVKQWGKQSNALLITMLMHATYSPLSKAHLKLSIMFKSAGWQLHLLRKADSKAENKMICYLNAYCFSVRFRQHYEYP